MKQERSAHRWVIDAIEEGIARVEQDGGPVITVPAWVLPAGAREGQVLSVTRSATDGTATITLTIDTKATAAALADSSAMVEKMTKSSKKRDAGGDVAL